MRTLPLLSMLSIALFGAGCSNLDTRPIPRPASVDVPRFMGDWYVIAHIPSRPEREAFDAVESYAPRPDGRIQTTFTYRKGSFQAPLKSMHPIGKVEAEGNGAVWGMQFIWPIQAEYIIAWVDEGGKHASVYDIRHREANRYAIYLGDPGAWSLQNRLLNRLMGNSHLGKLVKRQMILLNAGTDVENGVDVGRGGQPYCSSLHELLLQLRRT